MSYEMIISAVTLNAPRCDSERTAVTVNAPHWQWTHHAVTVNTPRCDSERTAVTVNTPRCDSERTMLHTSLQSHRFSLSQSFIPFSLAWKQRMTIE